MSHLRLVHSDRIPEAAGRVPPHDLDAEAAVLSAMILDGNPHPDSTPCALDIALEHVPGPEFFYSDANQRIFEAARAIRLSGVPVDAISVGSWLRDREWLQRVGGSAYLGQLVDATPEPRNVADHAKIVVAYAKRRAMIASFQRYAAELYYDVGDLDEYTSTVRKEVGALTAPSRDAKGVTANKLVSSIRAEIAASRYAEGGVAWPWPRVHAFLGLMKRGQHQVLGGRSEHGKTAFAMLAAVLLARMPEDGYGFRQAVYIQSLDMSAKDLLFRTACSCAGVDAELVLLDRSGTMGLLTAEQWKALGEWLDVLYELPIVIDEEPVPPEEVGRRARTWRAAFEAGKARKQDTQELYPRCSLGLIIGDHAQKMADAVPELRKSYGVDRRARITAVSGGWCQISRLGFSTLLLSQITRPPKEKRLMWPQKEDLEGSGALEQDADKVFGVYAPEKAGNKAERWAGIRAILKLKGRFSSSAKALLLGHEKGWFYELGEEQSWSEAEEYE